MPQSKQGDGTGIQKVNVMGDSSDDDVIICVCAFFMYLCERARVNATCYLTVSACTL